MIKTYLSILFCFALLLSACTTPTTPAQPSVQHAGSSVVEPVFVDWPVASPDEKDMNAELFEQMLAEIRTKRMNLRSMLIVRHGHLVMEEYFHSYEANTKNHVFSITKSVVSALIGIAFDQGYIKGVDERVLSYFTDRKIANPSPSKDVMTLGHLLTMTSGIEWLEANLSYQGLYASPDWTQFMLDKPMADEPGTRFDYCSGCTHLLSAIIEEATGQDTLEFARQNLFEPLGIQDFAWDLSSEQIAIGGWGLNLTSRDMARIGLLYLHKGNWFGRQLISEDWVEKTVTPHIDAGDMDYGYLWWIKPDLDGFAAIGLAGQMIFVSPKHDLVVVTTAEISDHGPIFDLIGRYILPAIDD